MEELKKYLEPDERVLWSGRGAVGVPTLDKAYKKSFILRLVVCVVLFAVLTVLYVVFARETAGVKIPVILVIALVCAFFPLRLFLDMRTLRKTLYAATDRRLLSLSDRLLYVEYARIKEAALRKDEDGAATLLCGSKAVNAPVSRWRVAAIMENSAEGENASGDCPSFVLYAPEDPEGLRKALLGHLAL